MFTLLCVYVLVGVYTHKCICTASPQQSSVAGACTKNLYKWLNTNRLLCILRGLDTFFKENLDKIPALQSSLQFSMKYLCKIEFIIKGSVKSPQFTFSMNSRTFSNNLQSTSRKHYGVWNEQMISWNGPKQFFWEFFFESAPIMSVCLSFGYFRWPFLKSCLSEESLKLSDTINDWFGIKLVDFLISPFLFPSFGGEKSEIK